MIFRVKLQPNSKCNEVVGVIYIKEEKYYKIKIKSKAVDNKANEELVSFLSDLFNISKGKISFLKGEKNRLKVLNIDDFESVTDFIKIME